MREPTSKIDTDAGLTGVKRVALDVGQGNQAFAEMGAARAANRPDKGEPGELRVLGLRPQKYPRTGFVLANRECEAPLVNDRSILNEPETYVNIVSAIDGDTMEVAWLVSVSGNLDNTECDYQGKYAYATSNTSEKGIHLAEMTENALDHVVVFNIAEIEKAIEMGDYQELNSVNVVDGRKGGNKNDTRYLPRLKSPQGIKIAPVGIGNCFTALFLDSQVVTWNLEAAGWAEGRYCRIAAACWCGGRAGPAHWPLFQRHATQAESGAGAVGQAEADLVG